MMRKNILKKWWLLVSAMVCFIFGLCLLLEGGMEDKQVSADEPMVVSYKDLVAKAGNEDYSLVENGMFRYERIGSNSAIQYGEITGKEEGGWINKTFRFAFQYEGISSEFHLYFDDVNPATVEGYVFTFGNYGSPYVAISRGSAANVADRIIIADYFVEENVYVTEISFLQSYQVNDEIKAEAIRVKIFDGNELKTDETKGFDTAMLTDAYEYVTVHVQGVMNLSLGDPDWFEGELSSPETVIDISKVADIPETGTASDIRVDSYDTYKPNQLVEFYLNSADQSRVVFRTNNNINGNLTLGANAVVIEKDKIIMGINAAVGISGVSAIAYQNEHMAWYEANKTYKVQYGFLQYEKDGMPTHTDLVCRIYDGEELVFNGVTVLEPTRVQNITGFYINGTMGSFTVTPVHYAELCTITVEYPSGTEQFTLYSDEVFTLTEREIAGYQFVKWQILKDGEYEDIADGITEISVNGNMTLKAVYEKISEVVDGCKVSGVYVGLSDDIVFYYSIVLAEGYNSPYIICTLNEAEYTITEYTEADGKYVFAFDGVTPQYLTEGVSVAVYANEGENVAVMAAYSIMDYCNDLLEKSAEELGVSAAKYEAMQTLVVDLLNYGAAAQVYTNTNTDTLANEGLSEDMKTKATNFDISEVDNIYGVSGEEGKSVVFKAARLVFDNKLGISVAFSVPEETDYSQYKVVFALGEREYVINADDFSEQEISGKQYLVAEFREIFANCFSSGITVKVVDSEGEVISGTLTYSVNSFIARNYTEHDLYQKLWCYGVSAEAYNAVV